jgi:hypothetical protein
MFMLLAGVLAVVPVEDAVPAEPSGYGPDGYFSKLSDGARPMRTTASVHSARKVLFGKSGSLENAAKVVESGDDNAVQVEAQYLVLGKGQIDSINRSPVQNPGIWGYSATTPLDEDEVLMWSADLMTTPFIFRENSTYCSNSPCNTFDSGSSTGGVASDMSYVAKVSQTVGLRYVLFCF